MLGKLVVAALAATATVAGANDICLDGNFPPMGSTFYTDPNNGNVGTQRNAWLATVPNTVPVSDYNENAVVNGLSGCHGANTAAGITATFGAAQGDLHIDSNSDRICIAKFSQASNLIGQVTDPADVTLAEQQVLFAVPPATNDPPTSLELTFDPPRRAVSFLLFEHNDRGADVEIHCANGDSQIVSTANATAGVEDLDISFVGFVGTADPTTFCTGITIHGGISGQGPNDNIDFPGDAFALGGLVVSECSGDAPIVTPGNHVADCNCNNIGVSSPGSSVTLGFSDVPGEINTPCP